MNLESMFQADRAKGIESTIGLVLGDETFRVRIEGGSLEVERADADGVDALAETDPMTLVGILYYGEDLAAAEAAGTIRIEGDRKAVERLPDLFELPAPVELAPA